jgi:hypothetical protein
MRRRLVVILTFPLMVSLFLIGWVLYCVGSKHESLKKGTERKSRAVEEKAELIADEGIETGLIEEAGEEIAV